MCHWRPNVCVPVPVNHLRHHLQKRGHAAVAFKRVVNVRVGAAELLCLVVSRIAVRAAFFVIGGGRSHGHIFRCCGPLRPALADPRSCAVIRRIGQQRKNE